MGWCLYTSTSQSQQEPFDFSSFIPLFLYETKTHTRHHHCQYPCPSIFNTMLCLKSNEMKHIFGHGKKIKDSHIGVLRHLIPDIYPLSRKLLNIVCLSSPSILLFFKPNLNFVLIIAYFIQCGHISKQERKGTNLSQLLLSRAFSARACERVHLPYGKGI